MLTNSETRLFKHFQVPGLRWDFWGVPHLVTTLGCMDRWGVPSVCPEKLPGGSHTAGLVAWNTTVAAAAGGFGSYLYLYGFWEGNVSRGKGGGNAPWGTASSFPSPMQEKNAAQGVHAYHWHHQFQRHIILRQTHLVTMWIEGISSLANTKHQQTNLHHLKIGPIEKWSITERRTFNRFNVCSAKHNVNILVAAKIEMFFFVSKHL